MKKRTTEDFKRDIFNLFGNDFLVIGQYINNDTKIKMFHRKCKQEFDITPHYFLKKCDCPICAKTATYRVTDTSTFKKRVLELTGDKYEVIGEYTGINKKIKMKHKICGYEYETQPNNFLHGSRCPKCGGTLKKNTEMFKDEIYELVGNEYSLLSEYLGNNKKILFKHNTCGSKFECTPSNFLKGHRCTKCTNKYHKNTEDFKKEVYQLVGNEYEIVGEYINNKTKIKIKHNCGYEYETKPNLFLNGCRCPKCQISTSKGEDKIENFLTQNNVEYISQKKFNELLGVGNRQLSYDFYLPKYNLLIEYQGIQHEKCFKFFGGKKRLIKQQEHDNRKRNYAKNNNIKLLEIWYYDFDNIEKILKNQLST